MRAVRLWPAAVVLLAACSGDGVLGLIGRVDIRTDQVQYSPGDMLRVSVSNESNRTLHYSGCGMIVERIDPDNPDSFGFGRLCLLAIDVTVPIRPGTELRDSIEIPLQTPLGSYRVRHLLLSGSKPLPESLRLSNRFDIEMTHAKAPRRTPTRCFSVCAGTNVSSSWPARPARSRASALSRCRACPLHRH